jgi:hypothetical protein
MLVLPNLDMREAIECAFAAIVSPVDSRVEQLHKVRLDQRGMQSPPLLPLLTGSVDEFRIERQPRAPQLARIEATLANLR